MATVKLHINYPHLAALIKEETNKRKIIVKSFPVYIDNIAIDYNHGIVYLFADIQSKVKAGLDFKFVPKFDPEKQIISFEIKEINFKTKNLLLRGALAIIKNRIISEIEKVSEQPIDQYKSQITELIDNELNKATPPDGFRMTISTEELDIKDLEFSKNGVQVVVDLDQHIEISSSEKNG